ncbi:MAG: hypothetical protein LBI85_05415 [Spirochaetaceae bacterium]|jgi:uncharacterized integral membrane protein|nr:hypothetical protein [Spirochaetaceae bacterium]
MWRLLGTVILFAILLLFIGFNLNNRCDVSFWFVELKQVPVYLTVFSAFMLGLLCSIPLAFSLGRKRKAKAAIPAPSPEGKKKKDKKKGGETGDTGDGSYGID